MMLFCQNCCGFHLTSDLLFFKKVDPVGAIPCVQRSRFQRADLLYRKTNNRAQLFKASLVLADSIYNILIFFAEKI